MAPTRSGWLSRQMAKHPTHRLSKAALRIQMRMRMRVELVALVEARNTTWNYQSHEINRIRHFLDDTDQDDEAGEEEGDKDDVAQLDGNKFPPPPPPPSAGNPPTIAIGKWTADNSLNLSLACFFFSACFVLCVSFSWNPISHPFSSPNLTSLVAILYTSPDSSSFLHRSLFELQATESISYLLNIMCSSGHPILISSSRSLFQNATMSSSLCEEDLILNFPAPSAPTVSFLLLFRGLLIKIYH